MVIEAADSGAARSTQKAAMRSVPEMLGFLTPDGRNYVAWQVDGAWVVADFEDMLAVMREGIATGLPGPPPSRSTPWPKNKFVEQGVESVAGRTGKRFVLRKEDGSLVEGFDFVISADADIAPIGRAFSRASLTSLAGMKNMVGDIPPEFAQIAEILARGTLIRMGRVAVLKSVEAGPIDPARFALPAAPASRDQLRRAMSRRPPPVVRGFEY